jgi:predicted deacylase
VAAISISLSLIPGRGYNRPGRYCRIPANSGERYDPGSKDTDNPPRESTGAARHAGGAALMPVQWRAVLALLLVAVVPAAFTQPDAADAAADANDPAPIVGAAGAPPALWGPVDILDHSVLPGSKSTFLLTEDQNFDSSFVNSSVWVVHGASAGPALCLTAGIHGDEINGVEIARRVFSSLDAATMRGSVIILPMINLAGIRSGERYMADRRDLNRLFPGRRDGSLSSIVAGSVFKVVTSHCQALIDLHTGSFSRLNIPQIRVTSARPGALDMARHFGSGVVVLGEGPRGSLRREASVFGLDAIIYEAGGPHRFVAEAAQVGADGVRSVMAWMGILDVAAKTIPFNSIFRRTYWERVPLRGGGFFFPAVEIGARVEVGDQLGSIHAPGYDRETPILARRAGTVIGMAVPQIVLSGYALFNIGIEGSDVFPGLILQDRSDPTAPEVDG